MAGLVGGDGKLIAIIGDEDTVTGFVLAGVGHRTAESSNFLVVKEGTPLPQIEKAFLEFTNRDDVGIVLVNQHVAAQIRHLLDDYSKIFIVHCDNVGSKQFPVSYTHLTLPTKA